MAIWMVFLNSFRIHLMFLHGVLYDQRLIALSQYIAVSNVAAYYAYLPPYKAYKNPHGAAFSRHILEYFSRSGKGTGAKHSITNYYFLISFTR